MVGTEAVEAVSWDNIRDKAGCVIKWNGFTGKDEDKDKFTVVLDAVPNFMSSEPMQCSTGILDVGIGHDGALSIGDFIGSKRRLNLGWSSFSQAMGSPNKAMALGTRSLEGL
jgi:hypothetical protein